MKKVALSIGLTTLLAYILPLAYVEGLTLIFGAATLWFLYAIVVFGKRVYQFHKHDPPPPFNLVAIFFIGVGGLAFGLLLLLGAYLADKLPVALYQALLTYSYALAVTTFGIMAFRTDHKKGEDVQDRSKTRKS